MQNWRRKLSEEGQVNLPSNLLSRQLSDKATPNINQEIQWSLFSEFCKAFSKIFRLDFLERSKSFSRKKTFLCEQSGESRELKAI